MRWVITFSLFTLILASACSLDKLVIKKNKKAYSKAPFDVVIIPGYPYQAPSNQELFNIRLHWAKALYDRGIAKNFIFSGNAVHTPYVEGKIMKLYAEALGIPSEHIFEENKALHSNENIIEGKKLAKQLGFNSIAIATDPFQFSYMVPLVNWYSPGMSLISFIKDSMQYYSMPLPEIDKSSTFVENWSDMTQ